MSTVLRVRNQLSGLLNVTSLASSKAASHSKILLEPGSRNKGEKERMTTFFQSWGVNCSWSHSIHTPTGPHYYSLSEETWLRVRELLLLDIFATCCFLTTPFPDGGGTGHLKEYVKTQWHTLPILRYGQSVGFMKISIGLPLLRLEFK